MRWIEYFVDRSGWNRQKLPNMMLSVLQLQSKGCFDHRRSGLVVDVSRDVCATVELVVQYIFFVTFLRKGELLD